MAVDVAKDLLYLLTYLDFCLMFRALVILVNVKN